MLEKIKNWTQKSKENSYRHFIESELETDSEFYQGEYSAFAKLLFFLNELEQQYKDDFK